MNGVENFIAELPKDESLIVSRIRNIILDAHPRMREKLSYGVPYFSINRRICFVWPASIKGGPKDAKVIVGFCYANLLSNHFQFLEAGNRKQVYIARFSIPDEVLEDMLRETIHEAIMIDEQFYKCSKK